ncbi:MAG: hypothetical protein AB1505_22205 [Candidatus Latescibacterota bacterium]
MDGPRAAKRGPRASAGSAVAAAGGTDGAPSAHAAGRAQDAHSPTGGTRAGASAGLRLRRGRGGIRLDNGLLSLHVGPASGPGLFAGIESAGRLSLGPADLSLKLNRVGWRDHYTAQRRQVTVERTNDVVAVVRLEGDLLDGQGRRFGPWRARLHLWAGLPYLIVEWRLVNESDQAMAMLLDWSARIALPDLAGARVDFGPFAAGYDLHDLGLRAIGHRGEVAAPRDLPLHADSELSCRQERADQARLYHVTGDRQHAAWAQECYAGIVEESADAQASLDMLTTAGWMLGAVAQAAASEKAAGPTPRAVARLRQRSATQRRRRR